MALGTRLVSNRNVANAARDLVPTSKETFTFYKLYHCCCCPAALLSRLVIHGKGLTKMQQASNPAIHEFTCLFPYLILFLKAISNKQTNQLPPALINESADARFGIKTTPQKFERRIYGGFTWNVNSEFCK